MGTIAAFVEKLRPSEEQALTEDAQREAFNIVFGVCPSFYIYIVQLTSVYICISSLIASLTDLIILFRSHTQTRHTIFICQRFASAVASCCLLADNPLSLNLKDSILIVISSLLLLG